MRRLGDRREGLRMEVMGPLYGSLHIERSTHIVNVSATGILVRSSEPLVLQSRQNLRFSIDGREISIGADVCHVRAETNADPPRYLIGLQFISPPSALVNWIEKMAPTASSL
jgi:hypothetical protein